MRSIIFRVGFVLFFVSLAAPGPNAGPFPDDAGLLNVRTLGAVGDGKTDDTAAIQKAIDAHPNGRVIVYLPAGTYLVSKTLRWPEGPDGWKWKNVILEGETSEKSVIRLKNNCAGFSDASSPSAVIWTGPEAGKGLGNSIRNLTVDVGAGNPGAIGIQFNASHVGSLRDVSLRAGLGSGAIGLDMGYVNGVGPLLVKNLVVEGFAMGILTGQGLNSQTFEDVILKKQSVMGWKNQGQGINIRRLQIDNTVTALASDAGMVTLLDSNVTAANIESTNEARVYIRNEVESVSHPVRTIFESPERSLKLDVLETPEVSWAKPDAWVNVEKFGAKASDGKDDREAVQYAIDTTAHTVYLPNTTDTEYPTRRADYQLKTPILLRKKIQRLIGCEADLNSGDPEKPAAIFVQDGDTPEVVIERLQGNYRVVNRTDRTLIIKDCVLESYHGTSFGKVFFENVTCGTIRIKNQQMWARQLNVAVAGQTKRDLGPHIRNEAGWLWIFGMRSTGGGTLIETVGTGFTEVLGGLWCTTEAPNDNRDPMFVIRDAGFSVTGREYKFGAKPYSVYVRETRGNETKSLAADALAATDSGAAIPLFAGYFERPAGASVTLSSLSLPAKVLGRSWANMPSVVIDDLNRIDRLTPDLQPMARRLRPTMIPNGIVATGEFVCANRKKAGDRINLEVFVFRSAQECEAWWTRKFSTPDAAKVYRQEQFAGGHAAENVERRERIVQFDSYWIAARQSKNGKEYVKAVDHFVKQIRAAKK